MTATTPTLWKIEDHEGHGECSACPKTGLRWVATLSDGSTVGLECAKKMIGYRPAPTAYNWINDFEAIAEHHGIGSLYVLWRHKTRNQTRETRNGALTSIGGAHAEWLKEGWITA